LMGQHQTPLDISSHYYVRKKMQIHEIN